MSWRQAVGISAFCFGDANANAVRCASPTGLSGAIPRESVSNISSGWARMATICRCFGRPSGIQNPGSHGLTSSISGGAALGVSRNGWSWKRRNLRDCSEPTNARPKSRKRERMRTVNPGEPEPLWREVVGDPEPWRRGRMFLILLAGLTFCLQCLWLCSLILTGRHRARV